MGADMIATGMLLPVDGSGELATEQEIRRMFKEALAERDDESLEEVGDWLGLDEDDYQSGVTPRLRVMEAIDHLFGDVQDHSMPRDVTILWVKGMPLLVSGGPTWGDSPTESFDAISLLNTAHLVPELDRNPPRPDYITLVFPKAGA